MLIRKTIAGIIIASTFLWSCKSQSGLQSGRAYPRVENVTFTQKADTVSIYYDLLAEKETSRFDVQLLLSLGPDKNYEITPPAASGNLGENVTPGKQRLIEWYVLEDFPDGMEGKNVQFIVNAEQMDSPDRTWLYIAAGAILVGAGTAVGLLMGNGNGELPLPPTRPAGSN